MPNKPAPEPLNAKYRLDRLIAKSRAHLYKPMQIAEVLHRDRVHKDIDLADLNTYRRVSNRWKNDVAAKLLGKKSVLNSRYEDQLFDEAVLPPSALVELGKINRKSGIVETYIYFQVRRRFSHVADIRTKLRAAKPTDFSIAEFLEAFDGPALRRSIDKAYEVVVYSLFDSLVRRLGATVTLSVQPGNTDLLVDFEKFAKLVLGVDRKNTSIPQTARLHRVGTTNAADTGLDMWANFGPAVQVKHVTLTHALVDDMAARTTADKLVIVCKAAEKAVIDTVTKQVGLGDRIRGFITEVDLIDWYSTCFNAKYRSTLGTDTLTELVQQFDLEFPLTREKEIEKFCSDRCYEPITLKGEWSIE